MLGGNGAAIMLSQQLCQFVLSRTTFRAIV